MHDEDQETSAGQHKDAEQGETLQDSTPDEQSDQGETLQDSSGTDEGDHGDTFPRAYVEQLRKESRDNREQRQAAQQRADDLADRLWTATVRATGRLADPADCPRPADVDVDDLEAAAETAIADVLAKRPHLAARRAVAIPGQADQDSSRDTLNLAGILRARA